MDELIERIRRLANAHPELQSDLHFGPASEHDIQTLESTLGVRLPPSFRAYLLGFAGGMLLGYEFEGIPTPKAAIPPAPPGLGLLNTLDYSIGNLVQTNRRLKSYCPRGNLFICSDGGDYKFYLDTDRQDSTGECPVRMIGPGTPAEGAMVARDFLHFLEQLAAKTSFGHGRRSAGELCLSQSGAEVPMTIGEALTQLRAWCDRSRGEQIEIASGITGSFQSRGTFTEATVREIEKELQFNLPSAYFEFMAAIGDSSLFGWSPSGGHWYFYNPRQVIEVSQHWAAVRPEVERFCFVGEHRCMGDMMGFCIDRPGPANFDIYCHEYPFEEYVAISNEIKSWREFGPYVAGVVSRFGQDSL